MLLKISVLASGEILLDGRSIEMTALDSALQSAKSENPTVWYYRESASKDAPPEAMAVIQLVIKHKLPISISTSRTFPTTPRASRTRAALNPSRACRISPSPTSRTSSRTSEIAAGDKGQGGLVILRPNRRYLAVPPMSARPELQKFAEGLEQLIPSGMRRNVAVISYTEFGGGDGAPSIAEANKSIPFFGLLMGLTYLGHAVWVFEGHSSAFPPAAATPTSCWWTALCSRSSMRLAGRRRRSDAQRQYAGARSRDFQLLIARQAGSSDARLEFADQPPMRS